MNLEGLPYAVTSMGMSEVATVARLEKQIFSMPWSSAAFRYELVQNSSSEYLILRYLPWARDETTASWIESARRLWRRSRLDPSIIGYGGCWFVLEEAHISTLAVREAWRGRGLGELLLISLIETAQTRGCDKVTLEVRVSNEPAQNLYQKYGFEQVGRRKAYYSDNREDAYIMTTESISADPYRQLLERNRVRLRRKMLLHAEEPPTEVLRR